MKKVIRFSIKILKYLTAFNRNVKIDNYCEQRGCTRSWLINKAVSMYLSECLEDIADYNAATKAWEEYEKDGKKSFPAADVFAEAGL